MVRSLSKGRFHEKLYVIPTKGHPEFGKGPCVSFPGLCNEEAQTGWLHVAELYSLVVLEAHNSRHRREGSCPGHRGTMCSVPLSSLLGPAGNPWRPLAYRCVTLINLCLLLHTVFSLVKILPLTTLQSGSELSSQRGLNFPSPMSFCASPSFSHISPPSISDGSVNQTVVLHPTPPPPPPCDVCSLWHL